MPYLDAATCPVPLLDNERILLGHGSGGKLTAALIQDVFLAAFRNPVLERLDDQAALPLPGSGSGAASGRLAFTTDSFVVTPIEFPGGDIGSLAVHGTVNDLAMGGAQPLYLSAAFILEEGLEQATLRRIVTSMADAARAAGVSIVTGDTKVVNRGKGDRIYINTTGIGLIPAGLNLSADQARPGDVVLLSGTVGDHGMAILSQREGLEFEESIASDSAPLAGLVQSILAALPDNGAMLHVSPGPIRCMRDPTRGGLGCALHEIAQRSRIAIRLQESAIPVRPAVAAACELLGIDPLYVANEGKLLAIVTPAHAENVLAAMRAHPFGAAARRIGTVEPAPEGLLLMTTDVGGTRVLDPPFHEQLPRIC